MTQLRTPAEIEIMAEGGARLAEILRELARDVSPGIETRILDKKARRLIASAGASPVFLGYRSVPDAHPFPASICVSVNERVVHGIPSRYIIRDGDVVKIDIGLKYKGLCVDSAVTVGAGKISAGARDLLDATLAALTKGINVAQPGKTVEDVGFVIQKAVEKRGFNVVEKLVGHGIGKELHEEPAVPNKGKKGKGEVLRPGMVIAIEPMVAAGSGEVKELADESFATADGTLSAHFEHTVAITENGPRILTKIRNSNFEIRNL